MVDNDITISELSYMRDIFDDIDMKNRITQMANIIELTFDSFGILIKVKEVDIHTTRLQFIFHFPDKNSNLLSNHHLDLCIGLAIPPEDLTIDQDNKGKYFINIKRVNDLGYKIQEIKQNYTFTRPNILTRKLCNLLFQISYYFFRSAEKKCYIYQVKHKGKERDYKLITPYRNRYHKLKNNELIDEFNHEVKSISKKDLLLKNFAIQGEFDTRNIDYSEIAGYQGLSFDFPILIKDKKIHKTHTTY